MFNVKTIITGLIIGMGATLATGTVGLLRLCRMLDDYDYSSSRSRMPETYMSTVEK